MVDELAKRKFGRKVVFAPRPQFKWDNLDVENLVLGAGQKGDFGKPGVIGAQGANPFQLNIDQVPWGIKPMPAQQLPPNPVDDLFMDNPEEEDEEEAPPQPVVLGPLEFRTRSERSTRLPRFKLTYHTTEECRLRLEGTIITLQDQLVKVDKITIVSQEGHRGLGCLATTSDGKMLSLLIEPNGLNLRTPDPGYVQYKGTAYLYVRKPARIYKQGLNGENTVFIKAGTKDRIPFFGNVPPSSLLKMLEDRPVIQFKDDLVIDHSLRLSDRIAIVRKGPKSFMVEHRGHAIGHIQNGAVRMSGVSNPWVDRALAAVGLEGKQV